MKRISQTEVILCWINKEYYKNPNDIDDTCLVLPYNDLTIFLNNLRIDWTSISDAEDFADVTVEYEAGRKDSVLWRMLADNYITFTDYIEALKEWLWYEFKVYREDMKYPHFVFYVREYLEENIEKNLLINDD